MPNARAAKNQTATVRRRVERRKVTKSFSRSSDAISSARASPRWSWRGLNTALGSRPSGAACRVGPSRPALGCASAESRAPGAERLFRRSGETVGAMVFFKTLQRVVRLFGGNGLSFVHARPIVATLQPLAMSVLATFAAELLARDAAELGARWQEQAPSFAPRLPERMALAGREEAERIVRVFADALREESHGPDAVMRAGWGFGAAAYAASLSLHYMLKEIDLLEAILLFACERAAESVEAPMSTAADGVAVARRLQRVRTLFTLAATKGFTRSYVEALQEQYRTLRHDLRNPLGTIKNAVSLMSDETVPAEQRSDPRFRQMVVRNATSMDATIGRRLSDSSALAPALAQQEVSLRDVALHVRRTLRDEAGERGCQVEVDASLPTVLTDS